MNTKATMSLTALAVLTAMTSASLLAEDIHNDEDSANTVTIIGSKHAAKNIPGSALVVDTQQLDEMKYSDATKALQQLPGVYIQQEDGLGLRPNIGLRGTGTGRSGRISLMEDGVLIAPAPYAASSAYYFPTFDRITGIEVLKGPAAIQYGPFTVGGAINFLTRPIADKAQGQIKLGLGQDGDQQLYGYYSDSSDNFGYLIEANKHQYDGFKTITGTNNDTGFDKDDYVAKLRFNSDLDASIYQQFDLKLQHSDEDSDQTYLGLSDADYAANPYRQYSVTQLDNFDGEHDQIMATYYVDFNNGFDAKTTAYRNETKRNWFKLAKLNGESLSDVINSLNTNDANAAGYQAILDGGDSAIGALTIRDNNREYLSRGVQLDFGYEFMVGQTQHELAFGARLHEDEEDRFQRDGDYTQANGLVTVADPGVWGEAGNRIASADAQSYYLQDTISFGDWILTPGLRFEDVDLKRKNWSTPDRSIAASVRENSVSELLPGIGALWSVNETTSLLAGVNKGFAPPGNNPGDEAEESWNYEFGVRFAGSQYSSELIVFVNDYDNILGDCTLSNACDLENQGDKSNGGKAKTQGVELSVQGEFAKNWPARFAYTYTDSEFERSFDSDVWGDVQSGDAIPYIPEHQAQFSFGYDNGQWNLYTAVQYVDEVCTKAACEREAFLKTDSLLVVDLSGEYQLNDSTTLFATIDNLFEEDGIAGRQPYGARPVKDRHARLGVKFNF
ncbi:TonB-dependent receptor domain-containing protein [Kangiella sp. TOML190]|uniref:TonB-dependent receptor family protein n=1 Tax=Kangiella sp. TOML190 TaxID=2931351 RepID=UPI0020404B5B|nr:TonB-dependent receptor [Kangiella sp. TOML190]